MTSISIPEKQTVALVRKLGGPVEFVEDYPVQLPGRDEVLAKVLYTGVCQSGMASDDAERSVRADLVRQTCT